MIILSDKEAPRPGEIVVHPQALRRPIVQALLEVLSRCGASEWCSTMSAALASNRPELTLAGVLAGDLRLLGALPIQMAQGKVEPAEAMVMCFRRSAEGLTALAAQHLDSPGFPALARFAMIQTLALVQTLTQLGQLDAGELPATDLLFQRVCAEPAEPTNDIARNKPCPCGSGPKWKRCCGVRRG